MRISVRRTDKYETWFQSQYASIELIFEKATASGKAPVCETKLGPILTEYFGPREVNGALVTHYYETLSEHHSPSIVNFSSEGGPEPRQTTNSQWSLHGYTWPIEDDESGLHRRVEWILTEKDHPRAAILHRDQLRVGLILLHDSEPFSISVRIQDQLQGNQRWPKFSDAPSSARSLSIRVLPSSHQAPLDVIAESLDKDMTDLVIRGTQIASNSLKRSSSEGSPSVGNPQTKRARFEVFSLEETHFKTAPKTCRDYVVGWICALPIDLAATKGMLDEVHASLPNPEGDHNNYTLGSIGQHSIAVACLPAGVYGTTSAATVATRMLATFPSIRFSLMVGIGAGVPNQEADIRLGDVVVSQPTGRHRGVVQYDFGKALTDNIFERVGALNKPPQLLLTTLARIHPSMKEFTNRGQDHLFKPDYPHTALSRSCQSCDASQHVSRPRRDTEAPVEFGIICFEMEAAGLMDSFPCLVIRGICDYADSHKNKDWQKYAVAAAAAYAKEFLLITPARQVEITPKAT
ncbi:nucleoside phosphorylase domain-containing protein [Aspergillus insuetus]